MARKYASLDRNTTQKKNSIGGVAIRGLVAVLVCLAALTGCSKGTEITSGEREADTALASTNVATGEFLRGVRASGEVSEATSAEELVSMGKAICEELVYSTPADVLAKYGTHVIYFATDKFCPIFSASVRPEWNKELTK